MNDKIKQQLTDARPHYRQPGLLTCCLISLLLCLSSLTAGAADRNTPFRIQAHTTEVNQKTGDAVYRGNVRVRHGRLRIDADRVHTHTRSDGSRALRAYGAPAVMRDKRKEGGDLIAYASRLRYDTRTEILILENNIILKQDGDTIHCDILHYDLKNKTYVASSKNENARVHAIIHP